MDAVFAKARGLLLPAQAGGRVDGWDLLERFQVAVVELEAHLRLTAAGAAQGVAGTVERVGERDFGVALGDDADDALGWLESVPM